MCRIAGYLGSSLTLDQLLTKAPHSLRAQAHHPRELPAGVIGSDGYGFAWFSEEGEQPAIYRQTLPIWVDFNLDTLAPHLRSSCILASTRTATDGMPVAITNTPPFAAGRAAFVHNGSISDFHERVLEPLRAQIAPHERSSIQGNSDTEYLAALFRQVRGVDLTQRVIDLLSRVRNIVQEAQASAQLNLIVGDGEQLVAVRHAVGRDAPSLHFAEHWHGGTVVASEPMDETHAWTTFGADSILTLQRGGPPTFNRLFLR